MFKRNQEGQSMVEMALTMPILILIVAGILDLGRAYFTFVALSDAAAEGAAYAAIHPTDTAQVINRAADSSSGLVVRVMATVPATRAASIRSPRTWSTAACESPDNSLCGLVTAPSAPLASAETGKAGWKPKWGPHAAST